MCLHLDPPRMNHYRRYCIMLQALYIYHLKKKHHLSEFILAWFLHLFITIIPTHSTSTFTSLFPSLLLVLYFDNLFNIDNGFNIDNLFEVAFDVDKFFNLFPPKDEVSCFLRTGDGDIILMFR